MRHTSTLKRLSRRFRNDTSGAVAIIFALATLPVMIGAGMAIDIVRSNDAQSELQAALDAGLSPQPLFATRAIRNVKKPP